MPELVNHLSHAVRVRDDDGHKFRLRPGQVANVDGVVADKLLAVDGVDTANAEDKKAYADYLAQGRFNSSPTGKQRLEAEVSRMRADARVATVVVPLNQVIGDDDAPIGPPTGTITTKDAAAESGDAREKLAYAPNERLASEADNDKLSPVERKQAEAKAALAAVHGGVLKKVEEDGSPAVDLNPSSEGSQSSAGAKPKRTPKKSE